MTDMVDRRIQKFDPRDHLIKVKNNDYLETKWRLSWLRNEHPDAVIETENLALDIQAGFAMFKATVSIPNGGGSASGHGSETLSDWRDFVEKSETKALGRALAALGYGTQFCDDYDMTKPSGEERLVDAPVKPAPKPTPKPAPKPTVQAPVKNVSSSSEPAHTFTCESCGNAIVGNVNLSSQEQASLTRKRFGKMLCTDCSIKAKRAEAETRANA